MAGGNGSPPATEMAERARAQEKEEEMRGGGLRAPQTRNNDHGLTSGAHLSKRPFAPVRPSNAT
jgi:hypothetical protein